jgi:hypothetical protein
MASDKSVTGALAQMLGSHEMLSFHTVASQFLPPLWLGGLSVKAEAIFFFTDKGRGSCIPAVLGDLVAVDKDGKVVSCSEIARFEFAGAQQLSWWQRKCGFLGRLDVYFLRTGEALSGFLRVFSPVRGGSRIARAWNEIRLLACIGSSPPAAPPSCCDADDACTKRDADSAKTRRLLECSRGERPPESK